MTDIRAKDLKSDFDMMNNLPEENAAHAFTETRNNRPSPTWLGVGRDPRFFEVAPQMLELTQRDDCQYWGSIVPMDHCNPHYYPDKRPTFLRLLFSLGPGAHCEPKLTRRLLDGWMPILTSRQDERSIQYDLTIFTTYEKPITEDDIQGADLYHAYMLATGKIQNYEQWLRDIHAWQAKDDAVTVCAVRIKAKNVSQVPAYAFFKTPDVEENPCEFEDGCTYCNAHLANKVYAVSTLDGERLQSEELSVLLLPGEERCIEIWVPHLPVSKERALALSAQNFDEHLEAAKKHWLALGSTAARFHIPETAIAERVKAGLMHLETLLTGPNDKSSPLLACCGIYTPIGTESSPIIQYFDSVGWHDKARRAIDYFFMEHQKEDGFIQCYSDYQSETGPVLWTAAEHYRYTHDEEWVRKMTPYFIKSCDFILSWCDKNKTEEARRKGAWGLPAGKVADPPDFYASFFLNAGNCAALLRMAELLKLTAPAYAEKLAPRAEEFRSNLMAALDRAIANAPVIPLADGSWTPALPAWPEQHGSTTLYADGGKWFTHGYFAGRDCLTGPLYLPYMGVCGFDSYQVDAMLNYNQHPQTLHNAALSQPYYSRHDIAHLARGEVKLFLQCYYHQMAALQDRETYTFWEHYYLLSIHKTHEEAWFLMQTRWMFFYEPDLETLRLFPAVPRAYFKAGEKTGMENAGSYFGKLTFCAECTETSIKCTWFCELPASKVEIRLPHPEGRRAMECTGGVYDAERETVVTHGASGTVVLKF